MTSIATIFAYPIHPKGWTRPRNDLGYRVIAGWDDPDLVNGGHHRAVDLGNFRRGDPVYAPADCAVMGLQHFDGAKGVRFLIGGWRVDVWHLDVVRVALNRWTNVRRGTHVGDTGASGIGTGAHSHVEAYDPDGVRIDPEPYLLGRLLPTGSAKGDDSMQISGKFLRHVNNARTTLAIESHFRSGVIAGADTSLGVMSEGTSIIPAFVVEGRPVGTAPDAAEWYGAANWIGTEQAAKAGATRTGWHFGYYHSSVLKRTSDGKAVALDPVESPMGHSDADLAAAVRRAFVNGRDSAVRAAAAVAPPPQ